MEEQEFSWSNLSFEDFCKDRIAEELDNYKDCQVAVCDLAFTLTEGENGNGSLFCNTYESKEFIKHFFEEAGAYVQYEKENFGESRNPFDDAEAFVVCMEINGIEACLAESDYIQEHWDETITLDEGSITAIKSDLGMAEIEEELDKAVEQTNEQFILEKDFEVIDREEGHVQYIGKGGDVVVPPIVDGCVVRKLSCPDCGITNIDTTYTPALTYLDCTDNPLKAFDRAVNPNLTELHLETTRNKLTHLDLTSTTLDLSHAPNPTSIPDLQKPFCDTNKLTHLDVSSVKKPSFASAKAAAVGARDASVKDAGAVGKRHEHER